MSRLKSGLFVVAGLTMAGAATPEITIELADFATLPMTGAVDGVGNSAGLLARVNFLREEPAGSKKRLFANDLNGPLYMFDRATKQFSEYLNLNGAGGRKGLFHRTVIDNLLASGFISFEFDPDYARNGKFYTIHLEDPTLQVSPIPDNKNFPGLKLEGYEATPPIKTFGDTQAEAVLVEWTDSNIKNKTFEGTARELIRLQYNGRIHPMGDIAFNPAAKRGDADWRVMYVACGDGGSGEQKTKIRNNPQRLDMLVGKILRIIPDLWEHTSLSTVSENGRYRIPNDNPFGSTPGARKEIWAYGLRNPHRLTWDVDPADPKNPHLITLVIGLRTWETVDIVHKGANYGYSEREGPQQLKADNSLTTVPDEDKIPVRINESATNGTVTPRYPVIAYSHVRGVGGDAISSGFVYRGKAIPVLRGKFLFGDITTGKIWWADFKEMLAADDTDPKTMAEIHEVKITRSGEVYKNMAAIIESEYHKRGGKAEHLPGYGRLPGGRSDIRFATDSTGELYILSKSDGVIRAVVGATAK